MAARCYLYAVTAVRIVFQIAHDLLSNRLWIRYTRCLTEATYQAAPVDLYLQMILIYVKSISMDGLGGKLINVINGEIRSTCKSEDRDILSRVTINPRLRRAFTSGLLEITIVIAKVHRFDCPSVTRAKF